MQRILIYHGNSKFSARFHGGQTVSHSRMQLRLHAAKPCQSLGAWHIVWWYFTT